MRELTQLARIMRDWAETRGPAPSHKLTEWADAIAAACQPVAWGALRELTIEELRAEKALFKVFARTPGRANTPFSAWKARATIAAQTPAPAADAALPAVGGVTADWFLDAIARRRVADAVHNWRSGLDDAEAALLSIEAALKARGA